MRRIGAHVSTKGNLHPVFIHALYLVNLASDNPDLVKKSVDSLIFDLKNGQAIKSLALLIKSFPPLTKVILSEVEGSLSSSKTPLVKRARSVSSASPNS
ncbi:MAG: hypothetical protein AAB973_01155 [Patescibacteria group bacterium]